MLVDKILESSCQDDLLLNRKYTNSFCSF